MRSRRAQGLSINSVILIVLGLIVLIVSVLVFNKYYKNTNTTVDNSCTNAGGNKPSGDSNPLGCVKLSDCQDDRDTVLAAYCPNGRVCCKTG